MIHLNFLSLLVIVPLSPAKFLPAIVPISATSAPQPPMTSQTVLTHLTLIDELHQKTKIMILDLP